MAQTTRNLLEKSVIVAAHPDDEILWFSSILADVNEVLVCFLDVPSRPLWTQGRTRSMAEYPLAGLGRLDLTEAELFWDTDWDNPVETEYGLAVASSGNSGALYKSNFLRLKDRLRGKLAAAKNVFTHNPWGEYGNAEHIQVYRAAKALQQDLGFDLWVSSYFSNKTAALMSRSMAVVDDEYSTRPTNVGLATQIAELYKKNNCWTWYDDYRWPNDESFFLITSSSSDPLRPGATRPLHFVRIGESQLKTSRPGIYQRLVNGVSRRVKKLRNL